MKEHPPQSDRNADARQSEPEPPKPLDAILPVLYDDLRRLARRRLRQERGDHTLSTTGLVHEAYLRLASKHGIEVGNRIEFYAFASECMRRVLVDYARTRMAAKRGGGVPNVPFDDVENVLSHSEAREVTEIDLAMDRLAGAFPRGAAVLKHRLFGGLTLDEAAAVLGVSSKTVQRDWDAAIAWLRKEVGPTALGVS